MSWLDTVWKFVDNYGEDALKVGGAAYDWYSKKSAGNDYMDAMKDAATREWEAGRDLYDRTQAYNEQYGQWAASEAASRNAAARANAAARQAAALKAAKEMDRTYSDIMADYEPYRATAKRLLPRMEGAYEQGLGNLNMLAGYLQTPDAMSRIANAQAPVQIELPKQMQGARRR